MRRALDQESNMADRAAKAGNHIPAPLAVPNDLGGNAMKDIAAAMNGLLADTFALYMKTKNFHWHMSGPHFRDYHLLLDEHSDQIFAMTDPMAERVRKLGGLTLHSIGEVSRNQRIADNDAPYVTPQDMLAELREDNGELAKRMRQTHNVCDEHKDVATASLLEVWIDETERRAWFLYEASHEAPGSA
jgi:starvation-inducible DNA-binding protein